MRVLIAVLAMSLAASASYAQNLKASNPEAIADKIRSIGYKANLEKDDLGDPLIVSSTDGSNFQIFFYGCDKGKNCEWLQFYKGYTIEKENYSKMRQLTDEWNLGSNFSKAAIDDDVTHLSYSLVMKDEGIGVNLFETNFATWVREYVEFRRKIAETYE
jgi:hypothetical protein